MKNVALTVAVLSLGLAACQDNAADNNASAVNTVETEAEADVNAASNSADAALNAAGNELDAAGNAVENAGEAVENAADNATN
jgi:hypothetical protein